MYPTIPGRQRRIPRKVWFSGSTALYKGMGLCYDSDRTTTEEGATAAATSVNADRLNVVELPSTTNHMWFAGVVDADYPARTGGREVTILEPGSDVEVAILTATTANSTQLHMIVGGAAAGYWVSAPAGTMPIGRGSAKALQTVAAVSDTTTHGPISSSMDASAGLDAAGTTLTDTGSFAQAAAGDLVYLVGGATTADGTARVTTTSVYTVSSKSSDDAVVLTSAACAAASEAFFYAVRGHPTAQAYLQDGINSGCLEFLTPYTDGSGTTTVDAMVGGTTYLCGGFTLATGDAIHTIADGTFTGQLKTIWLLGALTTKAYLVSVDGEQLDGATDMATLEFAGDGDYSVVEWLCGDWKLRMNAGTTVG